MRQITERYLDGQTKSVTGTAVVARHFDYAYDGSELRLQEWERIGSAASPRWTKTKRNFTGRPVQNETPAFAGTLITSFAYDLSGRLLGRRIPGQVPEVSEYGQLGQLYRSRRDSDADSSLAAASTDRIQEADLSYEKAGQDWYRVSTQSRYETDNDGAATVLFTVKELLTLTGDLLAKTRTTDRSSQTTTRTVTVNRATHTVTETVNTPDSAHDAVSIRTNGRHVSASTPTVAQPTAFEYDGLGRVKESTDPRGIATVTTYSGSQVASVSVAGQATGYEYYPANQPGAGQVKRITQPDGKTAYHAYALRGELTRTWGSAAYPTETLFDDYG